MNNVLPCDVSPLSSQANYSPQHYKLLIIKTMKLNISILLVALVMVGTACHSTREVKLGPNPFITHMYTADPSGHVWADGRLYVYASHDIDPPRGCDLMDQYHVFSTADLQHWTDHGEIVRASQVPWGRPEGGFMWAPDCAYKNGKQIYTGEPHTYEYHEDPEKMRYLHMMFSGL